MTGQQPTQLGVLVSRNQDGKHQYVPQFVMELLNNPEPALECEPSSLTSDLCAPFCQSPPSAEVLGSGSPATGPAGGARASWASTCHCPRTCRTEPAQVPHPSRSGPPAGPDQPA